MKETLQTSAPSLGELFANGRRYSVPPFQRDYSWGKPEWEDLWGDVLAVESTGRDHYLGAIVLQRAEEDEDVFIVIDGQQRLATLSILVLSCVALLESLAEQGVEPDQNQERAELLRERLVSPKEAASLTRRSRLRLNKADDPFFQSALINGAAPANPRRLSRSERSLWNARSFFRTSLEQYFGEKPQGALVARFVEQVLARRLVFIEIIVDDEAAAYTVFETLNARGVALGTADLLKNFLFSKAAEGGDSDIEEMQRRWERLIETVPLEDVADLVHHHANTEALNVSKRDVFRCIRESVTTKKDAFDYVQRLCDAADWYAALLDANDEIWTGLEPVRRWVRVLVLLRAEQYRPLALAAAPKFKDRPADMAALFRVLAICTLRANVVLRFNSGDIYRAWNRAAVEVAKSDRVTPMAIARMVAAIYGDDEEFAAAFAELSIPARGPRKKLLRYLLAELEHDASGRLVDWETDRFTIEHVLPESGGGSWDIDDEDRARFANRLGNMIPLEAGKNRDAAQLPFAEKLAVYATSVYQLPKQLGGEDWSIEAIRQRSAQYAVRAKHIWRVAP